LHAPVGRVSFGVDKLAENFTALMRAVVASKPVSARGQYIRKISVSSTMGIGVLVAVDGIV